MKTGKLKVLVSVCLALLLVILLSLSVACAKSAPAPEAKTLEIGVLVGLTGFGSETEIMLRDALLLKRDQINNEGGVTVNGQKYLIKFIVEDIKGNADSAVAAAIKLVEQDKVKFIIGPCVGFMSAAVSQVTEPAKVLKVLLIGGGLPIEINPETPYTFQAVVGCADLIPNNYDYLVKAYPAVRTVAQLGTDEPGCHFFADRAKIEAEKRGLTIIATEFFPWGTEDYYPVWTKILATKPDAVDLTAAMVGPAASELKQGRELGFTGPCFHASGNNLYTIREMVGKAAATDYFNPSVDVNSPEMTPIIKEIVKLWQDKYGTSIEDKSDALFAWDALWSLMQAIEEAQSLDPTEVAKTWEKMTHIETTFGPGKQGGEQTYGIANHVVVRPCPLSRLNNGEVEFIDWYPIEIP